METLFKEYGLDFDNNKWGFGISTEIERADGTEIRTKEPILLYNKSYYCRIWIFKTVFIFSLKGFEKIKKNRNNFKIIWGIRGICPNNRESLF